MAEIQKVQIVDSGNTPPPAWATEKTLSDIKALQSGSLALLKKIAKADDDLGNEIDSLISSVKTGNKERKEGQHASAEQSKTLINRVERGFNAIKTVLNINLDNIQAPFDIAGASLNRFSKGLEQTSPTWSKWTGQLGIGVVIFGELYAAIQKTNESMLKMYGNGIVVQNGFAGLADGAMAAKLGVFEFAELLTKNATVAVSLGTKRTMNLSKMFAEATGNGSQLLMTSKESQEALFDTLETARSLGVLRNMNDTQVNNFTVDYLKNINELSEATGKNRDEIRKQTLQAAKSVDTFSALSQLPDEQRRFMTTQMSSFVAQFGEQTGGTLTQSLSRYMTRGMSGIDPSMRLMMSRLGGGMGDAFNEMAQAGKIGDQAGFKRANEKFIASIENMTDEQAKLIDLQAQYGTGQAKEWARNLLAMRQSTQAIRDKKAADLEADKAELTRREALGEKSLTLEKVTADRIKKEEAAKKSIEDSTRAYNNARTAIANMQTTMYKLIEALAPVLLPALEALADVVIFLTKSFNSLFNGLKDVLSPLVGDKRSGVAALLTTAAIAVIIKRVLTMMPAGAAAGGKMGGFSGVSGMGGFNQPAGRGGLSVKKMGMGLGGVLGAMALDNAGDKLKEGGSKGLAGLVGVGSSALTGATLGATIGGPWGALIGGAAGAALGIYQNWEDLTENLGEDFKNMFSNLGGYVSNFASGASEAISNGLGWIGDTASSTFGSIKNTVSNTWDNVSGFVGGLFGGSKSQPVAEAIKPLSNTTSGAAKTGNIGGTIGSAAMNAVPVFGLLTTLTKAASGLFDTTEKAKATIEGPVNPVITADQLNIRTIKYYDDSMASMLSMVEKLETLHSDLELLRLNADIASSRLIDTIQRSSPVIN